MDLESLDLHVGKQLRLRRQELKLTQRELAREISISLRQLQKYENGLNTVGSSRLYQFASILNVDVSYFFDGCIDSKNKITCHVNDNKDSPEQSMVNELISSFVSLPTKTKENLLQLIKDLESQNKLAEEILIKKV
jgi:transcriptional regulator with XRE-family HTH domain